MAVGWAAAQIPPKEKTLKKMLSIVALASATLWSAGPAAAQDAVKVAEVPADTISLHYHRPDGSYAGWGVHFWESFEKVKDGQIVGGKDKSDMPILGISWASPMKPTGTDDFGPYWQVKANEFRNGKINYIIHKGDSKDCAKDSTWMLPQGRQVFINAGDCTPYFTLEEALKARK
ncbi:MAG: pullulanase [Comamonadaceae bacterium]|nr:pullulanase [Comamonadaceae bacterium]